MATDLFDAAQQDSALITEINSAVEQTIGSIDTTEAAQAAVARAASDPELVNNLTSKLQAVASAHGFTLSSVNVATLVTSVSYAAGVAFAAASIVKFDAQKPRPDQLEFAVAASLFT